MNENGTIDRRQFLKAAAGAAAAGVAATPLLQALPAAAQEMMYSQAPMLDDMGLPPVEERLPSNPRVIPVFEEIGEHGGTWRRGFKGRADMQGPAKLFYAFGLHFQYTADLSNVIIVNGLYDEWSQNDDSTEYTFHMREGMKLVGRASLHHHGRAVLVRLVSERRNRRHALCAERGRPEPGA